MTLALEIAAWVSFVGILPAFADGLRGGGRWWGTGRHISRLARGHLGIAGAELLRFGLWFYFVGAWIFGDPEYSWRIAEIVWNLWVLDDYWFGERPRKRKLLEWAKAKLRKAKPVMRRLAEQWKPRAPRVPVPA